jgi:hypothetical protein
LILGGGAAGGGKSYVGSVWLISSCIRLHNTKVYTKFLEKKQFQVAGSVCLEFADIER